MSKTCPERSEISLGWIKNWQSFDLRSEMSCSRGRGKRLRHLVNFPQSLTKLPWESAEFKATGDTCEMRQSPAVASFLLEISTNSTKDRDKKLPTH